MDPDAAWVELQAALVNGPVDWDRADHLAEVLSEWLGRGGFVPANARASDVWSLCDAVRVLYRFLCSSEV